MKQDTLDEARRGTRWTKEQIADADRELALAFAACGLIEGSELVCPTCHTSSRKKVQIKSSKGGGTYWKCHKCPEAWGSSAIELVMAYGPVSRFPDAVGLLLGEEIKGPDGKPLKRTTRPAITVTQSFTATVDWTLYDQLVDAGSLEAAQAYYSQWHIAPEAVAEAGSTMLLDAKAVQTALTVEHGMQVLKDAGLVTIDKNGNDVFLFSDDYPVIEPHRTPSGHVVGLQFRPSVERMAKVQAHKTWKRAWSGQTNADGTEIEPTEAWRRAYENDETVGRKAPYVTPFLSLRGAGTDHLVGCGLPRLVSIPQGSTVYIVEGFKDLLAARTMGVEAYAIPGTGVMPPEKTCQVLALHNVVVVLDGDDAGAAGRTAVVQWLTSQGVAVTAGTPLRAGMDVADMLVERHAHAGCPCRACTAMRDAKPYIPSTCPCQTCGKNRD